MSSLTPDTAYLTGVTYLPERRAVLAEFSNSKKSSLIRFRFFPRMLLAHRGISRAALESIVALCGFKSFRLDYFGQETASIAGATFAELEKLAAVLRESSGISCLLPEPERQFLLERGWNYFDSFRLSEDRLRKSRHSGLPRIKAQFLADELPAVVRELACTDRDAAEKLLRRFALSNLLCVPLHMVPANRPVQAELMLENIFFRNNFLLPRNEQRLHPPLAEAKQAFAAGMAELSFSPAFCEMLTSLNVGLDSLNCGCCRPASPEAGNISPSSLIMVRFNSDAVYFESSFRRWAAHFHKTMPNRERRASYKREWCLNSLPAGPFYMGQRAMVPLVDARRLVKEGVVSIEQEGHRFFWFCRKHGSVLSSAIKEMKKKMERMQAVLPKKGKCEAERDNTIFSYDKSSDIDCFFAESFCRALSGLLYYLPLQLLSPASRFYSADIADSIACIQAGMVESFRQFSLERGCRAISINRSTVCVEPAAALALAAEFAAQNSIPLPHISIAFGR